MNDVRATSSVDVAACTAVAAHRRDHVHGVDDSCHPHVIEVVHLGRDALVICHDCCVDAGFRPEREAESIATQHRMQTMTGTERFAPVPSAA